MVIKDLKDAIMKTFLILLNEKDKALKVKILGIKDRLKNNMGK